MTKLCHVDLFSGIGGFALSAGWAGFETRLFCECEPFCQAVLRKHWPGVPIIDDIRCLSGDTVRRAGIERVDIITGGFPCPPFSFAGRRRGKEDDRYFWPQMLRVIADVRPTFVVAENVPGIISMALDDALSDLEAEGYATGTLIIPACGVSAPHERYRVWIIAHASGQRREIGEDAENGLERSEPSFHDPAAGADAAPHPRHPELQGRLPFEDGGEGATRREPAPRDPSAADASHFGHERSGAARDGRPGPQDGSGDDPDSDRQGLAVGEGVAGDTREERQASVGDCWQENWVSAVSRLCLLHDGVPGGLVRPVGWRNAALKALGNAITPQVAYPILAAIAEELRR